MTKKHQIKDLLGVMSALRDPETGCPWDLEQDNRSLRKYTIEECYELIDAIEQNDPEHICEELGDVLLQVVFYAQMEAEAQRFDFGDVVHVLTEKLIRRHPHVFAEAANKLSDASAVVESWEKIKQQEKAGKSEQNSLFAEIPGSFPALIKAQKVQKKAAKQAYDFENTQEIIAVLKDEIAELESALAQSSQSNAPKVQHEIGDILFSTVNLARRLKVNAEESLMDANYRFIQRVEFIEELLADSPSQWKDLDSQQQDRLWQQAKQELEKN